MLFRSLITSLTDTHGTWSPTRGTPVQTKTTADLRNFVNLAPTWARETANRITSITGPPNLQETEAIMLQTATDICGNRTFRFGGKPRQLKDNIMDQWRHHALIARRGVHTLMHGKPCPDRWNELRQLMAEDDTWDATILPEKIETEAQAALTLTQVRMELGRRKKRLDKHIREVDNNRLRQNILRKKQNLGIQKGSIQRAMGREPMRADMTALQSIHPDSITITLAQGEEPSPRQIKQTLTNAGLDCEITRKKGLNVTYTFAADTHVAKSIHLAKENKWTIHTLTREKGLAHQPTDILAGIEAELGDAGRSLRAICPQCNQNRLRTLANETNGTRNIETYCITCKDLITPTTPHILAQEVPWTTAVIEEFPKVPDNPEFRLSGKISMPELKHIIRHLALGKAPGPIGQLPAEVWRQAPDQVLEIVLNTVNKALSGEQQPDLWKGGRISFLLKKQELQLLKNWRPITLLELSYKIF